LNEASWRQGRCEVVVELDTLGHSQALSAVVQILETYSALRLLTNCASSSFRPPLSWSCMNFQPQRVHAQNLWPQRRPFGADLPRHAQTQESDSSQVLPEPRRFSWPIQRHGSTSCLHRAVSSAVTDFS